MTPRQFLQAIIDKCDDNGHTRIQLDADAVERAREILALADAIEFDQTRSLALHHACGTKTPLDEPSDVVAAAEKYLTFLKG